MSAVKKIAITTGDSDGIGLEVTSKALAKIGPDKRNQYFLWRAEGTDCAKELRRLDKVFKRITVANWSQAYEASQGDPTSLIDIESNLAPSRWVELMAEQAMDHKVDALVTAPLSKTSIAASGLKDKGHTDILKRVSQTPDIFMLFLGQKFNVVLLTDHVSLDEAYATLDKSRILKCVELLEEYRSQLPVKDSNLPFALVGCNPHAGEEGLLGSKEVKEFIPALKDLQGDQISIIGPVVGDVCFQERFWKKYSCYVASYHDQGLIPFKMVHGKERGIQVSLGLPFLRVSVDHGTAKDIFAKNKADASSMEFALNYAKRKLQNKPIRW